MPSSLTRAEAGNRITFRNGFGKVLSGIVLKFQSDSLLVGVQSYSHPWVKVCGKTVPNNSLWVVPFTHVVSTSHGTLKSDAEAA